MNLSRSLLIGLIVSAALNVFMIGGVAGVIWVRQSAPPAQISRAADAEAGRGHRRDFPVSPEIAAAVAPASAGRRRPRRARRAGAAPAALDRWRGSLAGEPSSAASGPA
jgi:uncharacterized membrane protein